MAGGPALAETRLAVVTGDRTELAAAAVWGLVRSAQSEHPGRIVLVELDDATRARAARRAAERRTAAADARRRRVKCLGWRASAQPAAASRPLDPDGTVLVTGGTGTLGALTARHLVTAHGIRHLVLVSRTGAAPVLADELTALGASVTVTACDTADRAQLDAVLRAIPAEHPLTAVVHTAGVLDDGVLTELTPERVDTVLRPKLDAALPPRRADPATRTSPRSSCSPPPPGVLGNPGQGELRRRERVPGRGGAASATPSACPPCPSRGATGRRSAA